MPVQASARNFSVLIIDFFFIKEFNLIGIFIFDLGEAQVRVAVEVAEQFIALTGRSKEYTKYDGVINRDILAKY